MLWLSAALSAIAFAMSVTVRGETDRAATGLDELRSYYLASGAVERAAMELLWTAKEGSPLFPRGVPSLEYEFPSGHAHVEIVPEVGKVDVNKASQEQLFNAMMALGIDAGRAGAIASGIVAARSVSGPSFQSPNASFQEIEEIMAVNGVTPDIFYGTWAAAGNNPLGDTGLVRRPGLVDCLTVWGAQGGVRPSVLNSPLYSLNNAAPVQGAADAVQLVQQGNSVITFRATARIRLPNGQLSDLRRTVGASVRYMIGPQYDFRTGTYRILPSEFTYQVLRWYDTAWSN